MNDLAVQNTAIHAEPADVDTVMTRSEKIQKLFKEYQDLKRQIKFGKGAIQLALEQDPDYAAAKEEAAAASKKKKAAQQRIEAQEVDTCTELAELKAELTDTEYALSEMIRYDVIDRAKKQEPNPMQMSLFDNDGTAYSPVFYVSFTPSETKSDKEAEATKPEQEQIEPPT